jgi:hypothetical protein
MTIGSEGVPTAFGPTASSWLVGSFRLYDRGDDDVGSFESYEYVPNRAGKTSLIAAWDRAQQEACEAVAAHFHARVCLDVLLAVRGER